MKTHSPRTSSDMEATLQTWSLCPTYVYKCNVLRGPEVNHPATQVQVSLSAGKDLDYSGSNLSRSIRVILLIFTIKNLEYVCERMNRLLQYPSLKICLTFYFSLSFCFKNSALFKLCTSLHN
jgi:hypothetical protein